MVYFIDFKNLDLLKMYIKRFFSTIIIFFFTFALFSQTVTVATQPVGNKKSDSPQITFQNTTHNFGVFDISNGLQSCYFVFTNTGSKNLTIVQAVASCGCTVPEYPKTDILPGAKDSIKVTYNGATQRPGVFSKRITLRTNSPEDISYLTVKGEMVDSVTMKAILDDLKIF